MSTMRVMAMISLLIAGAVALIGLYQGDDLNALAILCGVFIGPAFAGKALQKHIEVKGGVAQ